MADVTGRDRGQLFLVGALIIATLLVVLALFLNSGIYAQNLSARNADPGISGAVEYRGATASATEETMVQLNRDDPANASYSDLNDSLATGLTEWSNGTAVHGAYRGKGRSVSVDNSEEGTLIRQNETRAFTNESGNATSWTVVDGTSRVRGFRLNVSQDNTTDISGLGGILDLEDNSFHVNITGNGGAGDTYSVFVGKTGTGEVNVTVDDPSGSATCEQPFDANSRATVDLTNASVEGTHCAALEKLQDASPGYTIAYGNPGEINGTYELVVRSDGTIDSNDFHDGPDDGSPWTADAVYSATVDVFFRARTVTYDTAVEVVPEAELA